MSPIWFALGAVAWSAAEYSIHRFVGHGPRRARARGLGVITPAGLAAEFNAEHLAHHADPSYFAPTSRKLLAAAVAVPTIAAVAAPVLGVRRALAFGAGFAAAYGAYEVLHRRIHTHPPTSAYGRWRRRHHLLHHHRAPRDNHGVTSPALDLLLGTYAPADGRVRVPRHVAPPWMLDPAGELLPAYAADYELVGRRARPGADEAPAPVVVPA